jgi:high-affinity iron transporter
MHILIANKGISFRLGADVDDAGGNGPGSYDVRGNVWHLACCNPEAADASQGWMIFGAVFGWTNSATLGSVLAYVFYWVLVIVLLVSMKVREVRNGQGSHAVLAAHKNPQGRTSIREALHRRSEKSSLPT